MLGFLIVYSNAIYPSICLNLKAILKSIKNAWVSYIIL
ncbi:hypothetical protein [Campylobacter phage CP20]|uniref:Uncharacterized protein n=1 Tax=Campylobacter phage CP20 TaxID=2506428 RepID=A0A410T7H1_9CAUD|nr:hypothetical protein [Campylobacter phage CP20]